MEPTWVDRRILGIIAKLVLETTRRTAGMALPVIASTFILIGFVGPYMPGVPNHSGVPLNQFIGMNHLSVEKVFKVPLGVSADLSDRFDHYGRAGRPPLFFRVHFGDHLPR